jgi:hypothetical protein
MPVVSAAAQSAPAASMVQALSRSAPASNDDRVSLADLTLIAVASATQQMAATEAGGRPQPQAAPPPASAPGGNGKPGEGGAKPQIEELARKAFAELRRLVEIERERSGHSWES